MVLEVLSSVVVGRSRSGSRSGSGAASWTFGRPMMFMHHSSLLVAVTSAASHFGREDNSGLEVVDMDVGVPSDSNQGQRFVLGPGISSGDDATSEAVKHGDGGDDGDGNTGQSHGVGIDIPWDRSRLQERYGMPGGSGSGSGWT